MTLYVPQHRQQYDYSSFTAQHGCTWTSGATGADAATGGRVNLTPDQVKMRVGRLEETNPSSPGWSMADLDLAMRRLGVPFENLSGGMWSDVVNAVNSGRYVVLQGDSDQFGNATCSGLFDGDHAIGMHPDRNPSGLQRINDPICPTGRWESRSVLRAYAEKLARSLGEYPRLRFGVFMDFVPNIPSEVIVESLSESPVPYPGLLRKGTLLYSSGTDATGSPLGRDLPVLVVGQTPGSTKDTGRRYVHGNHPSADEVRLSLVNVKDIVR